MGDRAVVVSMFSTGSVGIRDVVPVPANYDGVEMPPSEIRDRIDKTAAFVHRSGEEAERRLRNGSDPRFTFLREGEAYHLYYQRTLAGLRGEVVVTQPAGGEAIQGAPKKLDPPPEDHWTVHVPEMSAFEHDLLRLAAIFVAYNGDELAPELRAREGRDGQTLAFLEPEHTLHAFFRRYVHLYRELLGRDGPAPNLEVSSLESLLQEFRSRSEWNLALKEDASRARPDADEESARIDWTDFVIVETVHFNDDTPSAPSNLPAPPLPSWAQDAVSPSTLLPSEDLPAVSSSTRKRSREVDETVVSDPLVEAHSVSRDDGAAVSTPKSVAPKRAAAAVALGMVKCPKCQEMIPVNEFEEHMKTELKDPHARAEYLQKQQQARSSNFADGVDVASSLQQLTQKRLETLRSGGSTAPTSSSSGKESSASTASAPEAKPVVWDGYSRTIRKAKEAAQQQATPELLREQRLRREAAQDSIGPAGFPYAAGAASMPFAAHGNVPAAMAPTLPMYSMNPMMFSVPPPMMNPFAAGAGYGPARTVHSSAPQQVQEPSSGQDKPSYAPSVDPEQFALAYPGPVEVVVQVPSADSSAPDLPFHGQILTLNCEIRSPLRAVKQQISELLSNIPANRLKLSHVTVGALNDNQTLAFYNLSPPVHLEVSLKVRGGRNKK